MNNGPQKSQIDGHTVSGFRGSATPTMPRPALGHAPRGGANCSLCTTPPPRPASFPAAARLPASLQPVPPRGPVGLAPGAAAGAALPRPAALQHPPLPALPAGGRVLRAAG